MATHKDFKLIAETISQVKDDEERRKMAEFNARSLAKTNPRFCKDKFLAACNVED